MNVSAGGCFAGRVFLIAQLGRCFFLCAGALAEPDLPMQPPGIGVLGRAGLPGFRVFGHFGVGHVATFGIAHRVENALDMPAVG